MSPCNAHTMATSAATRRLFIGFGLLAAITVFAIYRWSDFFIQDNILQIIEKNASKLLRSSCTMDTLLCGLENKQSLLAEFHIDSLKEEYYRCMTQVDYDCPNQTQFGRDGDGGYNTCMVPTMKPEPGKCLVYSFGIAGDWSFDDTFSKYGCEVHSFDPSIGLQDHIRPPNTHFHNLGLWGDDRINPTNWKLQKLSTIRKNLGHDKRIIDVLKVDVEGAEWPFLRNLIDNEPKTLQSVRQLLLELHTPKFIRSNEAMSTEDYVEIIYYAARMRRMGFKLYKNVQRNNCCGRFSPIMPPKIDEKCCYESFYVNTDIRL